jgi:adenylate cyclase
MAARPDTLKLKTALLAGAAAALLTGLFWAAGVLGKWELTAHDLRSRWTIPEPGGHPEIVLALVSDDCIDEMARENDLSWPWDREVFAFLFRACGVAKARSILFDFFVLVDRGEGEEALIESIRKSPPVVVAAPFKFPSPGGIRYEAKRPDAEAILARYAIEVDSDGSVEPIDPYDRVLLPQPRIAPLLAGMGDVSTPRDPDGLIRRYALFVKFKGKHYPSLPLADLMIREGVRKVEIRRGVARVGKVAVPLERDGSFRMRWYRQGNSFMPRAAMRIIGGLKSIEDGGKVTTFDPKDLEGKTVIMGTNAAGLYDLRATPVSKVMPGPEIHAVALANLLRGDLLRDAPPWIPLLGMVGVALAVALATRFGSATAGGAAAAGILAVATGANVLLYRTGWAVDLVPSLLAGGLAYASASALNFLYEGRQRQRIKRDFQKYMSPKVVEKILKNPDALSVAGERKMLTVFFMDFAGFTSMSEKLDAAELVTLISEYHNEAAEEIFRTEGTIDKYIGDAIMAFWNDPIEQDDHALRACLASLAAQRRLREMAAMMKERGLPEMKARIGINTGIATVGNMGAKNQVNYTVIGDEVNLASRLEGVNKEFGSEIIISEATYQPAKERLEVRELALIKVKGRKAPVRIFELLGAQGAVEPARLERARAFERALHDLHARKFAEARAAFAPLAAAGDGPAELYEEVCERYLADPPPPDWDGSYQMESK